MRMLLRAVFLVLTWSLATAAAAETVVVKYRGAVDLEPFSCVRIDRSSLVQRICYDAPNQYMLINLNGTYYHYCGINSDTVLGLVGAQSVGSYYNQQIKGRFDCRVHAPPQYGATSVRKAHAAQSPAYSVGHRASSCSEGLSLESITDDGSVAKLNDGSIWEIDGTDTAVSSEWVSASEITACDDKLINTDDGDVVAATRIR